jgi:3-oxoadipate enol-lactonase
VATARIGGLTINYALDGPEGAPAVTFGHAQILDLRSWEPQVAAFQDRCRVLRLDFRGHGGSALSEAAHGIEDLAGDVVGLLDALAIERTHYVGSSLGGMVGFALALAHPQRLRSLSLVATQGDLPTASAERLRGLIAAARAEGETMAPQADAMLARYVAEGWSKTHPADYARLREMAAETPVEGFARSSEAIIAMAFDHRLAEIRTPTLVIAGERDQPTPPERMRLYQDEIDGAEMTVIEGAGHFPNFDQPDRFNARLEEFLSAHP